MHRHGFPIAAKTALTRTAQFCQQFSLAIRRVSVQILCARYGLADILSKAQIVPDLRATNRWEAIDELIGNLVATGKIQPGDRDAVTAAVKNARSSMSTGIGFGIASRTP